MALAFTALSTAVASTSNTTSYAATAGTPVSGDLLVCFVIASGCTSGTMSGTWVWSLLTSFTKNSGVDTIFVFYAQATAATSTTCTFNSTSGNATGCIISPVRITGGEGTGSPYCRQIITNTGTAANPTVVFSVAPLTGNGILGFATNGTNSAVQWTAPTSFTEVSEVTYNTPPNSGETVSVASGITATTITWTNANTTAWGTIAMELYVAGTSSTPDTSNSMMGFFGGMLNI